MKFTSSLPDMEPSVAISALQQFPKFAETSIEIIECYKQIVGKELDHNADNMKSFNDTCQVVIVSLQSLLDKDDLTFEEKNKVIDKMMSVLQMQADKDSENKNGSKRFFSDSVPSLPSQWVCWPHRLELMQKLKQKMTMRMQINEHAEVHYPAISFTTC